MMRSYLATAAILLTVAACGPRVQQGVPERRVDRTNAMIRSDNAIQLTRDASIVSNVIAASPDQVWQAMPQIYAALELPLSALDEEKRVLEAVNRVRRIAGKSISNYFSCASAYGNLASSGDVYLTVRSQVLPQGEGSQVRHEVQAIARSSTGSTNSVQCSSRGGLESLLEESVARRFPSE